PTTTASAVRAGCRGIPRADDTGRSGLLGVRSVRELAELARDEVRRLFADVDRVVADPLQTARDEQHPQAPLARRLVGAEAQDLVDHSAVRAVDQLVQLDEALGTREVALLERVE